MNRNEIAHLAAALLLTTVVGTTNAAAQTTFQTYRCADGTEFIVGFFQYDKRAHMQVDGKAVTLQKRAGFDWRALFGGRGDAADDQKIRNHAQGRQAQDDGLPIGMKKGRNLVVSTLFYLAYRA